MDFYDCEDLQVTIDRWYIHQDTLRIQIDGTF